MTTPDSTTDDLVMRRIINAPRTLVFAAFTQAEHLEKWWGPHGFTNANLNIDARQGGAMEIDMIGPDGTTYPNRGIFRELVAPERIVFTGGLTADDGTKSFEVLSTITLVDVDGKTELTLRARVLSEKPGMAEHLDGMEEGWSQSLERLEALATTISY